MGGQAVRHGRQSQKSLWGSLSGRRVTLAHGGEPPGFRVEDGTEAEEIGGHPEGGKGQPGHYDSCYYYYLLKWWIVIY